MPDLRKDPIVGRWVIIAHERAKRPHDLRGEAQSVSDPHAVCPFCEGHEHNTLPEVLAHRERGSRPNAPGWRVRVVPNRFPALKIEGALNKRGDGIYDMMAGVGAHEVIIENPKHMLSMAQLSEENIREVLQRLLLKRCLKCRFHSGIFLESGWKDVSRESLWRTRWMSC